MIRHCLALFLVASITSVSLAQTQPSTPKLGDVRVEGHGPIPAILIPGYTCDSSVYDRFMHDAGDQFTFYAVTLAGFGGTTPPNAEAQVLDDAVAAIHQLVVDRKIDRPLLVGHSLGALLTYRLLAEHPEDFRAGVCIDGMPAYPVGGDRARSAKSAGTQMRSSDEVAFRASQMMFMNALVTSPVNRASMVTVAQRTPQATAVQYFEQFLASDYTPLLPKIKAPILLMVADSPLYGPRAAAYDAFYENAKKAINHDGAGNCKMVRFAQTRHFIMLDAPDGFSRIIEDFSAGKEIPAEVQSDGTPKPATAPTAGP